MQSIIAWASNRTKYLVGIRKLIRTEAHTLRLNAWGEAGGPARNRARNNQGRAGGGAKQPANNGKSHAQQDIAMNHALYCCCNPCPKQTAAWKAEYNWCHCAFATEPAVDFKDRDRSVPKTRSEVRRMYLVEASSKLWAPSAMPRNFLR